VKRPRTPSGATALLALGALIAAACGLLGGDDADTTARDSHPAPGGSGDTDAVHARAGAAGTACSSCHEKAHADPAWRERAMAVGHDAGLHVAAASDCTCCHLGPIEGFAAPTGERCAECHEDVHVTIPAMGETHCLACHDLTPGHDLREAAWECRRCHESGEHGAIAVDVHAGEPCESCHQPHEEPWVLAQGCEDCHGGSVHVKHGASERARGLVCDDCHQPHEVAGEAPGRCIPCHQEQHPGTFSATVFPGHDACTSCHAPHAFEKEQARDCPSCHAEKVVTAGPAEHGRCSS
jgi:ssDNA-binding Zn-finger/Zn-ribbon topoisomerase 1